MTIQIAQKTKLATVYTALFTNDATKGGTTIQALADKLGISNTAAQSLVGDLRRRKVAVDRRKGSDGAWWLYTTDEADLVEVRPYTPRKTKAPAKTEGKATTKAAPTKATPTKGKASTAKSRTRRKAPATATEAAPAPATA